MPATNKFSFANPATVHLWRASLEADAAQVAAGEALLDAAELARARRFHFERDRRRFTLARGFLRLLLGRYLEQDPRSVAFGAGPHGKPCLASPGSPLRFNLSHSGTQALFAFAQGREVGVDLEAGARLGDDFAGLARRIFSAREQRELASLPPAARREAFLNGWTRKEAYLKATGQGLVNGLQQIEVTLGDGQPAFLAADLARKWSVFDLRAAAGVAGALVVEGSSANIEVLAVPDDL